MSRRLNILVALVWLGVGCGVQVGIGDIPTVAPIAQITPVLSPSPLPPTETPTPPIPPTHTPPPTDGSARKATPDSSQADGSALIDTATNNLNIVNTYKYHEVSVVEFPSLWLKQTTERTCWVQNPAVVYCTISDRIQFNDAPADPQVFEFVQVETALWMRREGALDWEELSWDEVTGNDLQSLDVVEYTQDVISLREGVMDSTPAYEVRVGFDMRGYLNTLLADELAESFDTEQIDQAGEGRWWISSADGLLRRSQVETDFLVDGFEIEVKTNGEYFDFNMPFALPAPFDTGFGVGTQDA